MKKVRRDFATGGFNKRKREERRKRKKRRKKKKKIRERGELKAGAMRERLKVSVQVQILYRVQHVLSSTGQVAHSQASSVPLYSTSSVLCALRCS